MTSPFLRSRHGVICWMLCQQFFFSLSGTKFCPRGSLCLHKQTFPDLFQFMETFTSRTTAQIVLRNWLSHIFVWDIFKLRFITNHRREPESQWKNSASWRSTTTRSDAQPQPVVIRQTFIECCFSALSAVHSYLQRLSVHVFKLSPRLCDCLGKRYKSVK